MPVRPYPIAFVLPTFEIGGAQRTVLNVCNRLNRTLFEPHLVLYRKQGAFLDALRSDIPVHNLNATRAALAALKLPKVLAAIDAQLVFSTLLYPNAAAYFGARRYNRSVPVVLRESNHHTASGRSNRGLFARITSHAYRNTNRLICLSHGVAQDCARRHKRSINDIRVIYNPVDLERIADLSQQAPPAFNPNREQIAVVAAGRMVRQKGFDLLIKALAQLKHLPWNLTLMGEGPEREALTALIHAEGLADRVLLTGMLENPYPTLAAADLFVLSSRWEGFGHVIVEAMACHTAVLATRCPSGPDEIITPGVDGMLCEPNDVHALATAMNKLINDSALRQRFVSAANQSVQRFAGDRITAQYESVFLELLEQSSQSSSAPHSKPSTTLAGSGR